MPSHSLGTLVPPYASGPDFPRYELETSTSTSLALTDTCHPFPPMLHFSWRSVSVCLALRSLFRPTRHPSKEAGWHFHDSLPATEPVSAPRLPGTRTFGCTRRAPCFSPCYPERNPPSVQVAEPDALGFGRMCLHVCTRSNVEVCAAPS